MRRISIPTLTLSPVLICVLFFAACLKPASQPPLPKIFPAPQQLAQKNKPPIILVPGILGSELVNQKTGERLWPEMFPKDRDALTLPLDSPVLAENRDDVIASRVIEQIDLSRLIPQIGVYAGLLSALENFAGYQRGDINNPPANGDHDTYYLFAYDWRRDNVTAAQQLAQKIADLKIKLNRPDLRFDLLAHSMGGLVARYYAMYGARDVLGETAQEPDWAGAANLNRLILLGTPNAGSFDAFRSILQGYSVTEAHRPRLALFRGLHQQMIFSVPSVYQLLPRNNGARFYDERLTRLAVNLFDPATWQKHQWSAAFDPAVQADEQKRLAKSLGKPAAAQAAQALATKRERYLRTVLTRAQQFHRALDAQSTPPAQLRWHLIGGDCEPTIAGAFILQNGMQTLFWPNGALGNRKQRQAALDLIFLPGDGRVTRQSLLGLTLNLSEANPIQPTLQSAHSPQTLFNCEVHGDLPLNLTLQNNLLTLLLGGKY